MRKKIIHPILTCFILALLVNCKEKYVLPDTGPSGGFLVVEGIINSGQGETNIWLSRTVGLADKVSKKPEVNAQVRVQGKDNSSQVLNQKPNGQYNAAQLVLNDNTEYRLYIKTIAGKEYVTDYSFPKKTPAIDTINWERRTDGVELFVNTHDPQNATQYYRWEYEETWEFNSRYYSYYRYTKNPVTNKITGIEERPLAESFLLYKCWGTQYSANILIGTSVQLSSDTIHLPLLFIPQPSVKISILYSINVRQYAISADEYEFLRRMKKNTEQVGSLFDAQPSELKGNIHCLGDPKELVMGYIGIADAREKRLFIKNSDLPGWHYRQNCDEYKVLNNPDTLQQYSSFIPTVELERDDFGRIKFLNVAEPICVDCTLRGTNVKPSFWP